MLEAVAVAIAVALLGAHGAEDPARDEAIAAARVALAQKQGVKAEALEVVHVEPVQWPDASLGCPEKGRMYLQMITPGYRVRLRVGGTIQAVHVAGSRAVVCGPALAVAREQPRAAESARGGEASEPESPQQKALVAKAREDLARRLSLSSADVKLVTFREVVWPDRGLGCPRPGVVYPQLPQDGVLIVLEAAGQRHEYHAGAGREPFLCTSPKPTPDTPR
jgi:hypothetical protein